MLANVAAAAARETFQFTLISSLLTVLGWGRGGGRVTGERKVGHWCSNELPLKDAD